MSRPNDTKERLVAAALELIETSSFGGVSVDQICERADVRKGSFYHFFPSKVDLAVEAFEESWRRESKPLFERLFRPEVPPLQRMLDLCSEWYAIEARWFDETGHVRGCPFCTVGSEMANQDRRLRDKAEELIERDLVHIESSLREAHALGQIPATDFRAKTRAIAGLLLGTKLQAKLQNDPRVLRDVGKQLLDLVGARSTSSVRPKSARTANSTPKRGAGRATSRATATTHAKDRAPRKGRAPTKSAALAQVSGRAGTPTQGVAPTRRARPAQLHPSKRPSISPIHAKPSSTTTSKR